MSVKKKKKKKLHRKLDFLIIHDSFFHWSMQHAQLHVDIVSFFPLRFDTAAWDETGRGEKKTKKRASSLGCDTARGLGGDTVTRWCYSNLSGRQSYAETEGLMSQFIMEWIWMCCRHPFACLWKAWMGTAQETGKKKKKKKKFRAQVQRSAFVHVGRCKMEKQIPGLHNWAAIWMTFPFLLCLNNGESGSGWEDVSLCKQCFFCFLFFLSHSTHCRLLSPVFSNDTEPIGWEKIISSQA